jgi:hypothetical protein
MTAAARRFLSARLSLAVWVTGAGRLVDDLAWGLRVGTLVGVPAGLVLAALWGWAG